LVRGEKKKKGLWNLGFLRGHGRHIGGEHTEGRAERGEGNSLTREKDEGHHIVGGWRKTDNPWQSCLSIGDQDRMYGKGRSQATFHNGREVSLQPGNYQSCVGFYKREHSTGATKKAKTQETGIAGYRSSKRVGWKKRGEAGDGVEFQKVRKGGGHRNGIL